MAQNDKIITMKKFKKIILTAIVILAVCSGIFISCTKYGEGFISPYMQYTVNQFSITRGRVATSYALTPDGSSQPLNIKWTHIYDATGKIVDDLFRKKYPITVWKSSYDAKTDTNYALILAKRIIVDMEPLIVNEKNGTIEANSNTRFLPIGTYTMDIEVSNPAGTQSLKNAISIIIVDGKLLETAPEQGTFRNQLTLAGTANIGFDFFNAQNNPYNNYTITRFADTPNIFILKVMDKNGIPFNPKAGEFTKRLNSGLNPNPPFLQNLQDYAPDTYIATDSTISLKYPLVPFPIASLGNGYNMYYRIPTKYVTVDSTTSWSSNIAGNFYKGSLDPHYLGIYKNDKWDALLRIPMRIQVAGAYKMEIKVLNLTHR